MTRINLAPPRLLTDQHLIAEIKEINQLSGQFVKSQKSKAGVDMESIPSTYRLGPGHVRFFYNKGSFLRNRFRILKSEAMLRGVRVQADFKDAWRDYPESWNQDYIPTQEAVMESYGRIMERVKSKPGWYRLSGSVIDMDEYINSLLRLCKKKEAV